MHFYRRTDNARCKRFELSVGESRHPEDNIAAPVSAKAVVASNHQNAGGSGELPTEITESYLPQRRRSAELFFYWR